MLSNTLQQGTSFVNILTELYQKIVGIVTQIMSINYQIIVEIVTAIVIIKGNRFFTLIIKKLSNVRSAIVENVTTS